MHPPPSQVDPSLVRLFRNGPDRDLRTDGEGAAPNYQSQKAPACRCRLRRRLPGQFSRLTLLAALVREPDRKHSLPLAVLPYPAAL